MLIKSFINFKDLSEMYNIEFKDKMYFCGGLDYIGLINEIKHFGIEPDKYMNSGIMLINLKTMRNDSIEDNLRTYISSHFLKHHDQTAINVVCYNNIQILPYKFGIFAYSSFENFVIFNNEQKEKNRFNILLIYIKFLIHLLYFIMLNIQNHWIKIVKTKEEFIGVIMLTNQ